VGGEAWEVREAREGAARAVGDEHRGACIVTLDEGPGRVARHGARVVAREQNERGLGHVVELTEAEFFQRRFDARMRRERGARGSATRKRTAGPAASPLARASETRASHTANGSRSTPCIVDTGACARAARRKRPAPMAGSSTTRTSAPASRSANARAARRVAT